jgi:hypothetical protein
VVALLVHEVEPDTLPTLVVWCLLVLAIATVAGIVVLIQLPITGG